MCSVNCRNTAKGSLENRFVPN